MPRERNRILKDYIILCEGIDTENFLITYLNSDALRYDRRFSENIQTLNFGGIDDLSPYIRNLRNMEGFDKINRLLVLRDAETDIDVAIRMVKKAFSDNHLPVPNYCNSWEQGGSAPATAFSLMPACSRNPVPGTLEDLCWNILLNENIVQMKADIENFISEIKKKYGSVSSHEHKSRIHTYFSVNEKFISLKIGEAAKAGAFNWNDQALTSLKEIIVAGFDQIV